MVDSRFLWFVMVPHWIISELSFGGRKWDYENTPKGTRLNSILAPLSHPLGRLLPIDDDDDNDDDQVFSKTMIIIHTTR